MDYSKKAGRNFLLPTNSLTMYRNLKTVLCKTSRPQEERKTLMSISGKRYAYGFALALAAGALAGVAVIATTAIASLNNPVPVDGDAVVGASVLAGVVGAVLAVPMYGGIAFLSVKVSEGTGWVPRLGRPRRWPCAQFSPSADGFFSPPWAYIRGKPLLPWGPEQLAWWESSSG